MDNFIEECVKKRRREMQKGKILTPTEPEFRFNRTDDKIQIFSYVHNVQMFPGVGDGSTCQNFVAECGDEDEAFALLDRLGVPRNLRPEPTNK